MSCAWRRVLRSMISTARAAASLLKLPAGEQLRPAEDGVERRAQLVRERGEEFILGAVRGLCLEPRLLLAFEQQPSFLLGAVHGQRVAKASLEPLGASACSCSDSRRPRPSSVRPRLPRRLGRSARRPGCTRRCLAARAATRRRRCRGGDSRAARSRSARARRRRERRGDPRARRPPRRCRRPAAAASPPDDRRRRRRPGGWRSGLAHRTQGSSTSAQYLFSAAMTSTKLTKVTGLRR